MMMAEVDQEDKHLLQEEREEEDERARYDGQMPNNSEEVVGMQAYISVAILCTVNLLNYVDRYTIAGK